ncbi:extracellular catalytic domain type 2 short-chain-length polyhydroxyalkanoate depolymerase [Paraburkholderia sp. CI3]|uniref:extracellular catalytic domain type 2 short-chain-length polyhydroxyalkanoate depolymerase n=1 Tax=Paraburkholderia sp. CI3 TaxID=2991060 RepID=UPI003D1B8869
MKNENARAKVVRLAIGACCILAPLIACWPNAALAQSLKAYDVKLDETTVSGISSGANMAVQFAVSYSSIVKGVGATAGGPYFCAGTFLNRDLTIRRVIAHCMQGDPRYPVIAITSADAAGFIHHVQALSTRGDIDPVENLARQRVWIFHGYNDGVVKKPVTDALYDFYAHYAGTQVFYKDNLRSGHAQIIGSCPTGTGGPPPLQNCNCGVTGNEYIKNCDYDAAGVLLQHLLGDLHGRTSTPHGELLTFTQDEFALDSLGRKDAAAISMGATGYVYVPASCAAMEPCRVHVALHGCSQNADTIGGRFAQYAGYNEWADANHLIVLYPQTASSPSFDDPFVNNSQGCWDWWGYNEQTDTKGVYATKAGLQIAAIKRMLDRLSGGYSGWQTPQTAGALALTDFTDRQVALRWGKVANAVATNVYRGRSAGGPFMKVNSAGPVVGGVFVDTMTAPATTYFYVIRSVDNTGGESQQSAPVMVTTASPPPKCDPYFSILAAHAVTKAGIPTDQTCP